MYFQIKERNKLKTILEQDVYIKQYDWPIFVSSMTKATGG